MYSSSILLLYKRHVPEDRHVADRLLVVPRRTEQLAQRVGVIDRIEERPARVSLEVLTERFCRLVHLRVHALC